MAEKKIDKDPYIQFEEWLEEQPYWLQDACFRIYNGLSIDDQQIEKYANMCISQVKKEIVNYKALEKNGSKKPIALEKMSIIGVNNIINVNNLASDASLEFLENGITVVYGLNGAGKSGFMRIFKQMSGSPYEEAIQPNVYKGITDLKPSCQFHTVENGEHLSIQCDLSIKTKETSLTNCDVFDTKISNQYISSTNNASYQPFVFTVLSELSNTAEKIKRIIRRKEEQIPDDNIEIPHEYVTREEVSWIKMLNERSKIPSVYMTWDEASEKELNEIPTKLDTEKVQIELKLCEGQLSNVSAIYQDLLNVYNAINSDVLKQSLNEYSEQKRLKEISEKLFTESADETDKLSVSLHDWKEMWRLAQNYFESTLYVDGKGHFGQPGTVCPLCHQTIDAITSKRILSVNDYVNGVNSERFNNSYEKSTRCLSQSSSVEYSTNQVLSMLGNDIFDEKTVLEITNQYNLILSDKDNKDIESVYSNLLADINKDTIEKLVEKKNNLEQKRSELTNLLGDSQRILLQNRLEELQCHKWINSQIKVIEKQITNCKLKRVLKSAESLVTTNKITSESNYLADVLLTEAYISRFNKELKQLAPAINVSLSKASSKKGSTPYKVNVNSVIKCKPEDVLSEGEQRIVALAAFFADATGRNEKTPLIIDDPISSLDINYENKATRRMVELAKERQVIVFTHRISLLVGISEEANRQNVMFTERHIRGTSAGKGKPDFEDIYHGSISTQLGSLSQRVLSLKKVDQDSREYIEGLGRYCQQFRICVERSVEDILLLGMVHRFERRIMTLGKVNKLTRITEDDCKMIDKFMTKYSFTEHSQPSDSPANDITAEELCNDISEFRLWIKQYNKRME